MSSFTLLSISVSEVSTRMVSEYKTKLQIAEAENARLEGLVRKEAWLSLTTIYSSLSPYTLLSPSLSLFLPSLLL